MQFRDRQDAGRRLGEALARYAGEDPLVLALPRGGVPVGFEVAAALDAPLEVWVVRKVGVPFQPELGMGAIAEGPAVHLDEALIARLGVSRKAVLSVIERERAELERRVRRLRGDRPPPDVRGRTVILVDDGIATGGTMRAALEAIRARGAARIVLAVPVAAPQSIEQFRALADEVVCLLMPQRLMAIGIWYDVFAQTEDDEVIELLDRAGLFRSGGGHARGGGGAR
jgi:putative phosphoribosyl transferase